MSKNRYRQSLSKLEFSFSNLRKLKHFCLIGVLFISNMTHAASDREDYDIDKDGLIELYDTEDWLALESTWSKGLAQLYGENKGCPETGCIGYELANDIDFSGITNTSFPFLVDQIFEGNNRTILNFTNRTNVHTGLFERLMRVTIRNLNVVDVNLSADLEYLGTLTPLAQQSIAINVNVSGNLTGNHFTGGLFGIADNTTIINSHYQGVLTPKNAPTSLGMGGLVGRADNVVFYGSSATGRIVNNGNSTNSRRLLGGLVGDNGSGNTVIDSYANMSNLNDNVVGGLFSYVNDTTIIQHSYSISNADDGSVVRSLAIDYYAGVSKTSVSQPATPSELACPEFEVDYDCAIPKLFSGWGKDTYNNGKSVWHWGTSTQLPSHNTPSTFDLDDNDEDGYLNDIDDFPENAAAFQDLDQDGKPDLWNPTCDETCRNESGLVLDADVNAKFTMEHSGHDDNVGAGALQLNPLWLLVAAFCSLCLTRKHRLPSTSM